MNPKDIEDLVTKLVTPKTGIILFVKNFLSHHMPCEVPEFHKEIYTLLTTKLRLALAAPRSFAKSTLVSVFFPIYITLLSMRKNVIIISASQTLAVNWLKKIKKEYETNEAIRALYLAIYGKTPEGTTWKENEIVLTNDVRITAIGAGGQTRGPRPDCVICHKIGSLVLTNSGYRQVEDSGYKKSENILSKCKKVTLWGLPESESVTYEHRYFTKRGWVEAEKLKDEDFIGYPINKAVVHSVAPSLHWMISEDFWWLVGYWWGDGHLGQSKENKGNRNKSVGFTVNSKEIDKIEKIKRIALKLFGKKCNVSQRVGCVQLTFRNTILFDWLMQWKVGNSRKNPSKEVLTLPIDLQKEVVKGYVAADGWVDTKHKEVRVTSIHLEGLYYLQILLSRIGIKSSIRLGATPRLETFPSGHTSLSAQKYDLRFKDGAYLLDYDIPNQTRYSESSMHVHIKDGYLWRKVRSIKDDGFQLVCPIKTTTGTYVTPFGLSHNCDDLETTEGVRSPEQRKYLDEWFRKDILGLLEPTGQLVVIGTILHYDSLLKNLVDTSGGYGWEVRLFQAYRDGEQKAGNELWGEKWTHEALQAKKAEQGSAYFASEYMNDPVSEDTAIFKNTDIRYYLKLPDKYSCVGVFDPAYSEETNSDFKVFVIIAIDSTNNRYLVDYIRTKQPLNDYIQASINLYLQYKNITTTVGIPAGREIEFYNKVLELSNRRGIHFPHKEIKNIHSNSSVTVRNKKERITMALQPLFQQGRYYIKESHEDVKDELIRHPLGKHDDLLDAMAAAEQIITPVFFDVPVENVAEDTRERGTDGYGSTY